ncbi:MAG: hypothetical protein IJI46_01230 [Erysipelotrichaceae bacterium]|nr:hypothetical protein [Erysipelotrichaceae bacterium]
MFLIETIDNAFQLISLGVLTILSLYQAFKTRKRIWAILTMFYSVMTLGELYWLLYMILYAKTPYYSFIPDFCWISAFLFLILLLLHIRNERKTWKDHRNSWLIPVFTIGMALFYMQWGEYVTNFIYAIFMTPLLFYSLSGMKSAGEKAGRIDLCSICFCYCVIEYTLWTVSCFFDKGIFFESLYYASDVALTIVFILLYPATRKAAEDELY